MHGTSKARKTTKGAGRSGAALRALLSALAADIAGFFTASRHALTPRRGVGRAVSRAALWSLLLVAGAGVAMLVSTMLVMQQWPAAKGPAHAAAPAVLLETQTGEPLGRIGALKLADAGLEEFPRHLIEAVLGIEDHRFYHHLGVDPVAVARATYRNFAAGRIVEGGSTITQQLMKVKYLENDRSYARKLREAVMAVAYELRSGKDEILTEYLNSVYMGAGAYGMPAAARLYFDKALSELTLSEAAILAGVIRSPSLINPMRDLEAAQARAAVVIDAMRSHGFIDEDAARQAKAEPAVPSPSAGTAQARSWFTDWASAEAADLARDDTQSVRVRTTLMPRLQELAAQAVNDVLAEHGERMHASQAALVAMLPSGAVVAMIGGRDYEQSQFNRAAEANRPAGSTFKVFVYLAALREGYRPDSVVDAGPVSIGDWSPDNHDGRRYTSVTLAESFAGSINTAAVRLAMEVGLDNVIAAARDLGIDAPLKPYPSLALGATGISLVDLTGAYASVRAGRRVEPWGIAGLRTGNDLHLRSVGGVIHDGRPLGQAQQAMIALLRGVVEQGTGREAALDGFAAGKTGTSQDYRDAWFVGFNERLVTGVWVGNDDNSPMKRVVGGGLPAKIWHRFMAEATKILEQEPVLVAMHAPGARELPRVYRNGQSRDDADAKPRSALRDDANADARLASAHPPNADLRSEPGVSGTTGSLAAPADIGKEKSRSGSAASGNEKSRRKGAACNVSACARAYRSFRASDCTYQPHRGPRQVCTRGGPGEGRNAPAARTARSERRDPPPVVNRRLVPPPQRFIRVAPPPRRVFRFFH